MDELKGMSVYTEDTSLRSYSPNHFKVQTRFNTLFLVTSSEVIIAHMNCFFFLPEFIFQWVYGSVFMGFKGRALIGSKTHF